MLTSARPCMISAALKWISSPSYNKEGQQVPQTSMPYVTSGTMVLKQERIKGTEKASPIHTLFYR